MSTEGFCGFLKELGHNVRAEAGVYWYNEHPHVYTSFPFQQFVSREEMALDNILANDGWVVRYPCDISQGRKSYRLACTIQGYGMHSLSGKARNQTRRGLEQCSVREVPFGELAQTGIQLNRETLIRQKRRIPAGFDSYWHRYYAAASRAEGACAWGAFVESELAAYLIAFEMDNVAHVLIVRSSTRFLKHYPNNALLFGFLQYALNDGRYQEVSIGLESIRVDLTSLDHFKLGMGFSKIEIGQRVELAPFASRLLSRPVLNLLLGTSFIWQRSEKLDKLAGLLTWYRDQICK